MRLSYSKLSTFLDCGLRYRLKYVEKVPSRPKPYLRFGKILHSVLKEFYSYPGPGKPELEHLLSYYRAFWPRENEGYRRYFKQGVEILERYYQANIQTYARPYWIEEPFKVPVGQHTLIGRFDRVDHLGDDRYEIVDYKTEKAIPTQEKVDGDLQLSIYALAFRKIMGILPEVLSVYHLRSNQKLGTVRTEEGLRQLEEKATATISEILGGASFKPRENRECRFCDYRKYCPLKSDHPEPIPSKTSPQMELVFA